VDLYLVTHHGLAASGSPQLVHAVRPRVAVMQNGTRKGGAPATFQILRTSPGLEDVWTLHWSYAAGVEQNSPGAFIANLDSASTIASVLTAAPGSQVTPTNPAHSPAYYIKISARPDGSFTVTNTRNGFTKSYGKR
jgi:competence protein ComEC